MRTFDFIYIDIDNIFLLFVINDYIGGSSNFFGPFFWFERKKGLGHGEVLKKRGKKWMKYASESPHKLKSIVYMAS